MNIAEIFSKHKAEFLKFDRIENKRSKRMDLHAFLLLDELFPATSAMVAHAENGEIWLDISAQDLQQKASQDQIIELVRCGVSYDAEADLLSMFV